MLKRCIALQTICTKHTWSIGFLVVCFATQAVFQTSACAQAGLRDSLERLDTNEDGEIQPDEITPLARPYLERVAKSRKMSLDRPNRIDKWQEAARIYYALQNGVAGETIRPEDYSMLKEFGPDKDQPLVPEFGLAKIKYKYIQEDLDEADQSLRRNDRNRDGYIDREEAKRGKWSHRDPFEEDLDKDNRLSRLELAQRYARRRLLKGASDELVQKARRVGNGIQPSERSQEKKKEKSRWSGGGIETYLTTTILGRYDSNRNGRLDEQEPLALGIPPGRIDANRDGDLTREELQKYFTELQDEFGETSEIVPGWFYELDENRDQQIVMTEFAKEWSDEKIAEFASYDTNSDGILTATEIVQSRALVGGSYKNSTAEILAPRKTVISEINVEEDFIIGDLNIQFSITHTHDQYLDGYLTGPDDTRIILFEGVGGHDDHFDQTVLDDQSGQPIAKARPPFKGTFQPHAIMKRQPGLNAFNGKSMKGVWQLVIAGTRNDRFGMLHNWSMQVVPQSDLVNGAAPAPASDGPQVNANREQPRREEPKRDKGRGEEDHRRVVGEKLSQADGWLRGIRERLSQSDISEQERKGLQKKIEQIEKYKQHIRSGGDKKKSSKFKPGNDDRREEKARAKMLKKASKN